MRALVSAARLVAAVVFLALTWGLVIIDCTLLVLVTGLAELRRRLCVMPIAWMKVRMDAWHEDWLRER